MDLILLSARTRTTLTISGRYICIQQTAAFSVDCSLLTLPKYASRHYDNQFMWVTYKHVSFMDTT